MIAGGIEMSITRIQGPIIYLNFAVNRSEVNGLVIIYMSGWRNPPRTVATGCLFT
ncbi:hypothetical protein AN403_1022 [Pseudomonas fluorescens]|uniref:Uncharacterized protein n=1 Tax=Pseudomonas fluorescens TaxID=294 RepID=A0A0P9AUW4_PSEFL|nr:hypothetical protein AN403_1022 [Pseudomonas fluorescens]